MSLVSKFNSSDRTVSKKIYKFLFLQGVYKQDCQLMEDKFHERLLENTMTVETKIYDKIPAIYSGISTWPKKSNLLCWFCHLGFKSIPWFEPLYIEMFNEGDVGKLNNKLSECRDIRIRCIGVSGVYCSCSCVVAHIMSHVHNMSDRQEKLEILKLVYTEFTGQEAADLVPSYPPTEMVQYGGLWTVMQYKVKQDALLSSLKPCEHKPISCISMLVDEDGEIPF